MVATALGAEGLGVEDGVHLLVAETPRGWRRGVAACSPIPTCVRTMVANAHRHFLEHFESGVNRWPRSVDWPVVPPRLPPPRQRPGAAERLSS